jgi:hypothetical protein
MENICICGKEKKLVKNCKNVYIKTCGDKECILKLRETNMLDKYGVKHALQSNEIIKKMKNKLIKKYGVDNISKLEEIKNKKIETCLKNNGVEHPMQSKIILKKSKNTVFKLYGVDNISKLEETIHKIKNTKNTIDEKTGLTIFEKSSEKRKEWYNKKHGVNYLFQTEFFKEEYKKIMIKKYGVDNYSKSKKFKTDMINKGIFKNDDDILIFNNFSKKVRRLTEKIFRENFDYLCKEYIRGEEYHLDHIYSIYDGFKNNIDPIILSSICNLQLIPSIINKKKSTDSWITKETLLERFNKISS